MEKNAELYNLTQQVQGAIFRGAITQQRQAMSEEEQANQPQPPLLLQLRGGYAESPGWILVQVMEFAPAPLSVEKFLVRAVYSAPRLIQGMLELMASEQWFDRIDDEYHITEMGQAMIERIRQRRIQPFETFTPIPLAEIEQLEKLLRKVIDASLEAKYPPGTWCLSHSRKRAPDEDVAALAKIIQYGGDFNAFRDDAHMAAFRPHNISGQKWEAFSFVQADNAHTAEELFAQLAYRGFTKGEWQAGLDDLTQRGWLENKEGQYQVTQKGQSIHTEVELKTDEYFYAPWESLSTEESDMLVNLLQKIEAESRKIFHT